VTNGIEKIIEKLRSIKSELTKTDNTETLEGLISRTDAIITKQYGANNIYKRKLSDIGKDSWMTSGLKSNTSKLRGLLDLIIDDLELSERKEELIIKPMKEEERFKELVEEVRILNNKIFIVHGHNEAMKQSVARIVEKLGLDPIILHEQANQGMTVIEKFLSNTNVGFALILLSADDIGYSKKEGPTKAKDRARQNVIFELGFFTAKLGRKKVVALVENASGFEIPSDIHGVIYIPFDGTDGKWRFDVAKELMDSGYNLDIKKIM